ncbi:hypothetical protein AB4212_27190 [Streptomyces sp. 2MCAF27]
MSADDIVALACNSIRATFADDQAKARMLGQVRAAAEATVPPPR